MTKNPKILVNLTSLVQGGLFPHWLEKYKYFQDHRLDLWITCHDQIYHLNHIDNIYNFAQKQDFYRHLHQSKISKPEFIYHSIKSNLHSFITIPSIFKHNFDIFYSPTAVLDLLILPFLVKLLKPKIKWVAVFDNIVPLRDPGKPLVRILSWIFFQISVIMLRRADQVFAISPGLKDYLLSHGLKPNQVTITGNAIETNTLIKAKKSTKYQFDSIYVGRINETKGIYDLLEVVNRVTKIFPKFTLAIMGHGDISTIDKFKQAISDAGLKNNFTFLGFRTGVEKYSIIKSSKIFIFLSQSTSESFGISLLEAVSCGLPAIAYDLVPFRRIYRHGEIFTYPIGAINQVAQKVVDIFTYKKFSNHAGKKLLGQYTWDKIAQIETNYLTKS